MHESDSGQPGGQVRIPVSLIRDTASPLGKFLLGGLEAYWERSIPEKPTKVQESYQKGATRKVPDTLYQSKNIKIKTIP
jgi:hypothetical protein